jgi:hypothetical protein
MTELLIEEVKEETTSGVGNVEPTVKLKGKRDIFRFAGEKPTAINLEHVTQIGVDGKRITFQFYSTAMFVDLEDEASALSVFEVVLNVWAG